MGNVSLFVAQGERVPAIAMQAGLEIAAALINNQVAFAANDNLVLTRQRTGQSPWNFAANPGSE